MAISLGNNNAPLSPGKGVTLSDPDFQSDIQRPESPRTQDPSPIKEFPPPKESPPLNRDFSYSHRSLKRAQTHSNLSLPLATHLTSWSPKASAIPVSSTVPLIAPTPHDASRSPTKEKQTSALLELHFISTRNSLPISKIAHTPAYHCISPCSEFCPAQQKFCKIKSLDDQFANVPANKSPRWKQYKVYLFERILLCCKEINLNKPKNKMLGNNKPLVDKKGQPKLQLKGRIFMQNVTDVLTFSRIGEQKRFAKQ